MQCIECLDGELQDVGDYLECEDCGAQFELITDEEDELELYEDEDGRNS
jgi:hypothetical protein